MTSEEIQRRREVAQYERGRDEGRKEAETQQNSQDKSPTGTPYSKKWVVKQ